MKNTLFVGGLLVLCLKLHGAPDWVEGFSFKKKDVPCDQHPINDRKSVMSQLKDFRGEDADFMSEADMQAFAAEQQLRHDNKEKMHQQSNLTQQSELRDTHHEENKMNKMGDSQVSIKKSSMNFLSECQQFFMRIFAKLYEKK